MRSGNAVSGTTTTNASGQYSFTGLNPSNSSGYTVTETPPAADTHLGQTSTTSGAVTTPATSPVVSSIVLTNSNSPSTDNFFETAVVSLGYGLPGVEHDSAGSLTTSTTGLAIAGTTVVLSGTDAFGHAVSGDDDDQRQRSVQLYGSEPEQFERLHGDGDAAGRAIPTWARRRRRRVR